jgi:hypothetical protein
MSTPIIKYFLVWGGGNIVGSGGDHEGFEEGERSDEGPNGRIRGASE